jgi:hypothetical protein
MLLTSANISPPLFEFEILLTSEVSLIGCTGNFWLYDPSVGAAEVAVRALGPEPFVDDKVLSLSSQSSSPADDDSLLDSSKSHFRPNIFSMLPAFWFDFFFLFFLPFFHTVACA